MSCSSNLKRLVGSCIRTLVSRTKSLLAGVRGLAEGLPDLRMTRVKGAGRVLRSTMSLLDDVGYGGDLANDCPPILAPGTMEHKGWWRRGRQTADIVVKK